MLRVKTSDIIPKYMALVLQVEGEYECFSRSNRASIQRIKVLTIQVPKLSIQQKIIDEITDLDDKIKAETEILAEYDKEIKSRFVEMFRNKVYRSRPLYELYDFQLGKTPTRNNFEYWNTHDCKWISVADMGMYDRITGSTSEYISYKAVKESGIKIVPRNTVIMSFKLTIGRTAITSEDIYTNEAIVAFLDKKIEYIHMDYLRMFLSSNDWNDVQMNAVKGRTLNKTSIGNLLIPIPPIDLQKEFAAYVESIYKLKLEAKERKESLIVEKATLIEKHFK